MACLLFDFLRSLRVLKEGHKPLLLFGLPTSKLHMYPQKYPQNRWLLVDVMGRCGMRSGGPC